MQHIHRYQITLLVFVLSTSAALAQKGMHKPNDDVKKWHFGMSVVPNFAKAKFVVAPDFYQRDSVMGITTTGFTGLNFGGIADYRIGKFFTLRYLPQLEFSQRNFTYYFKNGETHTAKTETVSLNHCLLLKHHSVRHGNHRFYVVGGFRYSYDFQSNEKTIRAPNIPMVAFKANTQYYELGFGYDHYGQWALISTEIKMSNSLGNILSPDPYIYASSLSRVQARLFQISFHFQNL